MSVSPTPERRMTDWHRLGSLDEVRARAPFTVTLERHHVAVLVHDGRVHAISNICNHKSGETASGWGRPR
jgi:nitrite reductase/ring-hydroxylating ferredoxin subunit